MIDRGLVSIEPEHYKSKVIDRNPPHAPRLIRPIFKMEE